VGFVGGITGVPVGFILYIKFVIKEFVATETRMNQEI
jgi:hypothetical protein